MATSSRRPSSRRLLECPNGHALKSHRGISTADVLSCDRCDADIDTGLKRFSCSGCDYDVCSKCAEDGGIATPGGSGGTPAAACARAPPRSAAAAAAAAQAAAFSRPSAVPPPAAPVAPPPAAAAVPAPPPPPPPPPDVAALAALLADEEAALERMRADLYLKTLRFAMGPPRAAPPSPLPALFAGSQWSGMAGAEPFNLIVSHRDGAAAEAVGVWPGVSATRMDGTIHADGGVNGPPSLTIALEEFEAVAGEPRPSSRRISLRLRLEAPLEGSRAHLLVGEATGGGASSRARLEQLAPWDPVASKPFTGSPFTVLHELQAGTAALAQAAVSAAASAAAVDAAKAAAGLAALGTSSSAALGTSSSHALDASASALPPPPLPQPMLQARAASSRLAAGAVTGADAIETAGARDGALDSAALAAALAAAPRTALVAALGAALAAEERSHEAAAKLAAVEAASLSKTMPQDAAQVSAEAAVVAAGFPFAFGAETVIGAAIREEALRCTQTQSEAIRGNKMPWSGEEGRSPLRDLSCDHSCEVEGATEVDEPAEWTARGADLAAQALLIPPGSAEAAEAAGATEAAGAVEAAAEAAGVAEAAGTAAAGGAAVEASSPRDSTAGEDETEPPEPEYATMDDDDEEEEAAAAVPMKEATPHEAALLETAPPDVTPLGAARDARDGWPSGTQLDPHSDTRLAGPLSHAHHAGGAHDGAGAGGSASVVVGVALTQADDSEAAGSESSGGGGGARYLDRNLLFSMGFGAQRVQWALDQSNDDPQVALEVLLNMAPEQPPPPLAPPRRVAPAVTLAARSVAPVTFASSVVSRAAAVIGSKKRPAEGGAGASASSSQRSQRADGGTGKASKGGGGAVAGGGSRGGGGGGSRGGGGGSQQATRPCPSCHRNPISGAAAVCISCSFGTAGGGGGVAERRQGGQQGGHHAGHHRGSVAHRSSSSAHAANALTTAAAAFVMEVDEDEEEGWGGGGWGGWGGGGDGLIASQTGVAASTMPALGAEAARGEEGMGGIGGVAGVGNLSGQDGGEVTEAMDVDETEQQRHVSVRRDDDDDKDLFGDHSPAQPGRPPAGATWRTDARIMVDPGTGENAAPQHQRTVTERPPSLNVLGKRPVAARPAAAATSSSATGAAACASVPAAAATAVPASAAASAATSTAAADDADAAAATTPQATPEPFNLRHDRRYQRGVPSANTSQRSAPAPTAPMMLLPRGLLVPPETPLCEATPDDAAGENLVASQVFEGEGGAGLSPAADFDSSLGSRLCSGLERHVERSPGSDADCALDMAPPPAAFSVPTNWGPGLSTRAFVQQRRSSGDAHPTERFIVAETQLDS